ncbi:ATP-binding protein [Bifidobacterium oedipodis]|uniref:ATP-binding protein n=1 Tax=Bifidobacterium oedipodis TaxID=2675322 RepID=A0A7Y0EMW8_9BIFI|nr:ATP-binding protein [Bifidobacterium sp. DSM 109957]NMM92818.1 ATP-binding protein [Bifidobacterium sp. DSM 109957]
MIIDTETRRKLREMDAQDLLAAFERLDERTTMPLSHAEVVRIAVDNAHATHMDAKIQRLVKRAGLRYPQADLRTIDLMEERGLDRGSIAGLDAGNYLEQRVNIVFQGATGSGKSHLLCALAKSACRGRYRAAYIRMPDLAEQVLTAAGKPGGVPKLVRKYATYNLLAIDEWLVDKPDEPFKRFLLELMELRYDTASTAFATQLATKEWHNRLGGDTIADAILDRIVHNTIWIDTGEYNMRQRHGQTTLDN